MTSTLTRHAATRLQQRCIPADALDLLWEHGRRVRSHGVDRLFFDSKARRRVIRGLDKAERQRTERFMNVTVLVADDGSIITAAWRTKRLRHH